MGILATEWFHPENIIMYGGVSLLLIVVFAETGLFFGFFLPGDSLLFVAGILSETKYLPLPVWLLTMFVFLAAASGSTLGYAFGYFAKDHLTKRKENFFYKKDYMVLTEKFYRRHGMVAFVIGRFLPVVRTFVPILAGIVRIEFSKFIIYNIIGAALWAALMIVSGHFLGNSFPFITEYLEIIIVGMILVSGIPIIYSWLRYKRNPVGGEI